MPPEQRAGYVIIAICWGIFSWTILVYGRLMYNLIGGAEGQKFTQSWGISVGLAQAAEARAAVVNVVETCALLALLEALWLLPNSTWLERTADDASVHAVLLRSAAASVLASARNYARFNARVHV